MRGKREKKKLRAVIKKRKSGLLTLKLVISILFNLWTKPIKDNCIVTVSMWGAIVLFRIINTYVSLIALGVTNLIMLIIHIIKHVSP